MVFCNIPISDLSLPQRNFHIDKATRLFSRIYEAIDEKMSSLMSGSLNDELKKMLTEVQKSTFILLDHLPKNIIGEYLIADFTKLLYDDLTDNLSSMQNSAAAGNWPIQTMGVYVNDSQQSVKRTIHDSSDEQQVNCRNSDPVVSDNETNNQEPNPGGSQPNTSLQKLTSFSKNQLSRVTLVKQHRPLCSFEKVNHHPVHCSTYKNASLELSRRMV